MDPATLHKLITLAFKTRDRAYAPYSKFRVGAALLTPTGEMIGGCNVENASYGGAICAERTAITKAVSDGFTKFSAVVVVSDIPTPSISPCGICRQVLREFFPLSAPVYMISAQYPYNDETVPEWLASAPLPGPDGYPAAADDKFTEMVKVLSMEQLLPMSFGPDELLMK